MLVGCGEAKSLADHNVEVVLNGDTVEFRKIEAEERVGAVVTSIAMSMILDLVRNMVTEQIMAFLGITTTTTPEPCGGLLGEEVISRAGNKSLQAKFGISKSRISPGRS